MAAVLAIAGLTAFMAAPAAAIGVRLSWSTVQNAAGYKLYVRQIGQAYGGGIDVGLLPPTAGVVSYVTSGVLPGISTFFAVSAYDALLRESGLSNELSLLVAGPAATATRTVAGPPPTVPPSTATATRSMTRTPTRPTATATRTGTTSRTPTATPRPPTSTTLGLTAIGDHSDSNDSNRLNGSLVVTSSGGHIVSMSAYIGGIDTQTANRMYEMAIYTNNGGRPGTLVARTARGTLVANSWNTLPIDAFLQANASYWLIYTTNGRSGSVNNLRYVNGPYGYSVYSSGPVSFGTWPATFPASTLSNGLYSLYARFGP